VINRVLTVAPVKGKESIILHQGQNDIGIEITETSGELEFNRVLGHANFDLGAIASVGKFSMTFWEKSSLLIYYRK
jgi:hypothetical protein